MRLSWLLFPPIPKQPNMDELLRRREYDINSYRSLHLRVHTAFGILCRHIHAEFCSCPQQSYAITAIMPLSQRRGHNKKEKEAARKRGPSLLNKGCGLGRKARVVSGAFYYEPTHHVFKMQCYLPKGETLPDLNTLVCT